jgi:nucleotide-binding universal stress UspA family protein
MTNTPDQPPTQDLAAANNPTPLRWGHGDVLHGDDDTVTVVLSGPHGEPYWLELDPERAAALRKDLAGPDGEEPSAAQTALRDRIADAVIPLLLDTLPKAIARARGYEVADAVLTVLPAEADTVAIRAAELDDTASLLQVGGNLEGAEFLRKRAALLREVGKRRPAVPRRGDTVEQWLKAQRDASADYPQAYQAADGLLDLYRLHADTRTPLAEHVCMVGDCDCLDQDAAVSAVGQTDEETSQVQPCDECAHPQDAHREGDDPVTPGTCGVCEADEAHHDYGAGAAT